MNSYIFRIKSNLHVRRFNKGVSTRKEKEAITEIMMMIFPGVKLHFTKVRWTTKI